MSTSVSSQPQAPAVAAAVYQGYQYKMFTGRQLYSDLRGLTNVDTGVEEESIYQIGRIMDVKLTGGSDRQMMINVNLHKFSGGLASFAFPVKSLPGGVPPPQPPARPPAAGASGTPPASGAAGGAASALGAAARAAARTRTRARAAPARARPAPARPRARGARGGARARRGTLAFAKSD